MFYLPRSVDLNKSFKQILGIIIDKLAQLIERNPFLHFKKHVSSGIKSQVSAENLEYEPFDTSVCNTDNRALNYFELFSYHRANQFDSMAQSKYFFDNLYI